jgi:hypothetical protein
LHTGDQSDGAEWGCHGTEIIGADGIAVGTGKQNTSDIEAECTTAGTAADICANLSLDDYTDWFLPSKDELDKLYLNKDKIGGFADLFYWSSSETNATNVWVQRFNDGVQGNSGKAPSRRVRAVRAF